jgi:hypothetical protein
MLLIISDTSVLIDLECDGLSKVMFSLPWQFAVPNVLFSEGLAEHHGHLLQLGLVSKTMSGELILV